MSTLWPRIEPLLARVQKPARYIGCEDGAISPPTVRNAAAIGVPCREWGEKVVLVVVPDGADPDPSELEELIRSHLRSSRVPAHIVLTDELPHNETGKVLRRVLRETHAHLGDDPAD